MYNSDNVKGYRLKQQGMFVSYTERTFSVKGSIRLHLYLHMPIHNFNLTIIYIFAFQGPYLFPKSLRALARLSVYT